MIKKRKYNKPSIQEAIFEAKFEYNSADTALAGQFFEQVKEIYPEKKNIELFTMTLGSGAISEPSLLPPQIPIIQAWKKDGSELVQAGPGIATANQLKYSSWEDFLPAIESTLNAYIKIAEPEYLNRLGVRYINRFIVPEENITILDYFNFGIQAPEALCNLQAFDLTFISKPKSNIDYEDLGFEVKIKFSTDFLKIGEFGNCFILDMDCYLASKIKLNMDQIISITTNAHNIINEVFESIITDKTRKLLGAEQ